MAVVLITGCSSGIGLETAVAFARRGDVTYASMRNPIKADALRTRVAAEGLSLHIITLDVTDDESVANAVATIEDAHGSIDVLVNNAGVGYGGAIETIPMERARALMETNVWGAVRTARAALPAMRSKGHGVIINVTSVAGRVPGSPHNAFYCASKHALGVLSESLHWEVQPFGVRVVCIEPGFFATEIFANSEWDSVKEGSPYEADDAWMNEFYVKSGEATGGDPSLVAAAIVSAVDDLTTPLHNLVGDDAVMFVGLVEQAGTFEGWVPVATAIVESVSGPRPTR